MTPDALPPHLTKRVTVDESGCWRWTGDITSGGYGRLYTRDRRSMAHRFAYELLVGPIPSGLELDHLCRVRNCINPLHLEPVTSLLNTHRSPVANAAVNARKTACKWGHPFTPENTYVYLKPSGRTRRKCKTCASNRTLSRALRETRAA